MKKYCVHTHFIEKDGKVDLIQLEPCMGRLKGKLCKKESEKSRPCKTIREENHVGCKEHYHFDRTEFIIRNCAVCLLDSHEGLQLSCGHKFCRGCIQKWFETNKSCPKCRRKV